MTGLQRYPWILWLVEEGCSGADHDRQRAGGYRVAVQLVTHRTEGTQREYLGERTVLRSARTPDVGRHDPSHDPDEFLDTSTSCSKSGRSEPGPTWPPPCWTPLTTLDGPAPHRMVVQALTPLFDCADATFALTITETPPKIPWTCRSTSPRNRPSHSMTSPEETRASRHDRHPAGLAARGGTPSG